MAFSFLDSEFDRLSSVSSISPIPNNRQISNSLGPKPIPKDQLKCNILKGKLPNVPVWFVEENDSLFEHNFLQLK